MSRKFLLALAAMLVASSVPSTSDAGWHSFWERAKLDWHRNHAWPHPFQAQDRMASCSPFVTMAQNGWAIQSTLTHDHFHPKTHLLTEAGQLKVHDILTQHPEQYRTIYVVRALTPDASEIRTDSVQQQASRVKLEGPLPQVVYVNIQPRGREGGEVKAISEGFRNAAPAPKLPRGSGP